MQTGFEEHPDLLGARGALRPVGSLRFVGFVGSVGSVRGNDGADELAFERGAEPHAAADELLLVGEEGELVCWEVGLAPILDGGEQKRREFAADAHALHAREVAARDVRVQSGEESLVLGGSELLDGSVERF